MITVDTIGRVRRAYFVQGRKIKAIARELRLARNTVRDIVRASEAAEATERHVADVTAKTLRETLVTQASRKSELHTDDALTYYWLGRVFEKHRTVNHSAGE